MSHQGGDKIGWVTELAVEWLHSILELPRPDGQVSNAVHSSLFLLLPAQGVRNFRCIAAE